MARRLPSPPRGVSLAAILTGLSVTIGFVLGQRLLNGLAELGLDLGAGLVAAGLYVAGTPRAPKKIYLRKKLLFTLLT